MVSWLISVALLAAASGFRMPLSAASVVVIVVLRQDVGMYVTSSPAAWSSGMILASGARGPGFNSRSSPFPEAWRHPAVSRCLSKPIQSGLNRSSAVVQPVRMFDSHQGGLRTSPGGENFPCSSSAHQRVRRGSAVPGADARLCRVGSDEPL